MVYSRQLIKGNEKKMAWQTSSKYKQFPYKHLDVMFQSKTLQFIKQTQPAYVEPSICNALETK